MSHLTHREFFGAALAAGVSLAAGRQQPNIVYMMADDHAAHAISAYGSWINKTPNIDRIAGGGVRMTNCFCTNSICTPIRTARWKLIYYYGKPLDARGANPPDTEPDWELFDLHNDPREMRNLYHDPKYARVVRELKLELDQRQKEAGDKPASPEGSAEESD